MSERKPNTKLHQARLSRGWTQKEVGERLGTDARMVRRWESGDPTGPYYIARLTALFEASAEELGLLPSMSEQTEQCLSAPEQVGLPTGMSDPTRSGPSMDTSRSSPEGLNRRRLLKRVRAIWID